MLLYSILLFLTALPFLGLGMAIYRGNTGLIHAYHRKKVKDNAAYGKAFGKCMFLLAASMLLSGIVAVMGNPKKTAAPAAALLFAGLIVSIACILAVQKKYNKGLF